MCVCNMEHFSTVSMYQLKLIYNEGVEEAGGNSPFIDRYLVLKMS